MMIDDDQQKETTEINTNQDSFTISEDSLRSIRNIIVGSFDNKKYYLNNGIYEKIVTDYLNVLEVQNQNNISSAPEQKYNLNLINLEISIIDSFIISNEKLQRNLMENYKKYTSLYTNLASITLKLLSDIPLSSSTQYFYENAFRLLANLKKENFFNVDQSFTNFISNIDKYLINDILFQSICIILSKICENSYYIHLITTNDKLVNKLIDKFYNMNNVVNISMNKSLIQVLVFLTEEDDSFSEKLLTFNDNFINILNKGIRFFDIELKILYINLLTNMIIYSKNNNNKDENILLEAPITMWSISILLNIITGTDNDSQNISMEHKISCVSALNTLLKYSIEFQNKFYNLNGIEILFKELKKLYTDEEFKTMEEAAKKIKENKAKKKEDKKEDKEATKTEATNTISNSSNTNNDVAMSNEPSQSSLSLATKYKIILIECLANCSSHKEESRKKLIDTKELVNLIIFILNDSTNPTKLLLSSVLLVLSLSRGHLSIKKVLMDFDIIKILFTLYNHQNTDIQIQTTNALSNFLLENANNNNEIIECVGKLIKIFKKTQHKKIRFNSICAIKNIFYSVNSNRDIKKNIMKKVTYELLINLLNDPEKNIVEQVLLIFRVLLFKSEDDIDEVFSHCKDKLLDNIYNKISDSKSANDIIIHSLYILSNISTGNDKQKMAIEKKFIERFVYFGNNCSNYKIIMVCLIILNNLMMSKEIMKTVLEVSGIKEMLEKIAFGRGKDSNNIISTSKEGNEGAGNSNFEENDEYEVSEEKKESKQLAMGMITTINKLNKEKDNKKKDSNTSTNPNAKE